MSNKIETLNSEDIKEVIQSLESPKQKWRTAKEVAEETGLNLETVQLVLRQQTDTIVRSSDLSETGELRYTTREHFKSMATPLEKLIGALKNRID